MNFREGSGDDFAPASANKNDRNKKKAHREENSRRANRARNDVSADQAALLTSF
jgi:hypothetical protein